MKIKKLIPILACVLGASSFAGCTSGSQTVELSNYWGTNKTPDVTYTEELEYAVSFEKGSGLETVGYDLNYTNGKYTTKLVEQKDKTYEYTTSLSIDVIYTLDGQNPVQKTDTITTTVKFEAATDGLRPISSEKQITCYSPLLISDPVKVEDCYYGGDALKYSLTTTYSEDGSSGKTVKTNLATNATEELSFKKGSKSTFLDNEQLPFALRAFSTDETTAKIKTYSPFPEAVQTIAISFAAESESAHTFKTLLIDGEEKQNVSYAYRVATMKIDAQNSGASQKIYITTKAKDRNVIIKMENPLSYSFGTLIYELTSISRTE